MINGIPTTGQTNFSDYVPAAPAGSTNVTWQCQQPGELGEAQNASAFIGPFGNNLVFVDTVTSDLYTISIQNGSIVVTLYS